jgi:glycosyltransferase involved in cell wall biosynthesis
MESPHTVNNPDASVVICTYNRAPMLRIALKSLISQQTRGEFSYEVVVIDDRSSDETPSVVEEITALASMPVRYFREEGRGVAAARNRGIAEALGEWVAYTDDDQWNESDWLYELVIAARNAGVDCVGGVVDLELPPEVNFPLTDVTSSILGKKRNPEGRITSLMACPGTGNVMFRRSVFDKVGVFNNDLHWGGEDADLMLRVLQAGVAVWFTPNSVTHHMIPPYRVSETYFRWASLRVGVALAEVDARVRGKGKMAFLCVARIGQALIVNIPRLLIAVVSGDRGKVVETKCLLWRAKTYVRHALRTLAPKLFAQEKFYENLQFRGERSTLASKKN